MPRGAAPRRPRARARGRGTRRAGRRRPPRRRRGPAARRGRAARARRPGPMPPAHAVAALERDERLGVLARRAGRGAPGSGGAGGAGARSRRSRRRPCARRAARAARSSRPSSRARSARRSVRADRARGREHRLLLPRARSAPSPSGRVPSSRSTASVNVPPTSTPRIATSVLCIAMAIRAFLFDFDGLIIDTEIASRAGWEWLYSEHGHELPEDLWATLVGTTHAPWSPMAHLEELVGEPLDRDALNERRYAHELALIEAEELRPGHRRLPRRRRRHGLKRAIVSSSSRRWIDLHLERLEETVGWDAICTADGDPARAKPRADALSRGARRCSASRRRSGRLRGLAERRPRREGGRDLLRRRPERGHARARSRRRGSRPRPRLARRPAARGVARPLRRRVGSAA